MLKLQEEKKFPYDLIFLPFFVPRHSVLEKLQLTQHKKVHECDHYHMTKTTSSLCGNEHLTHFKFLFQQKLRYFYLTVAAQISSGQNLQNFFFIGAPAKSELKQLFSIFMSLNGRLFYFLYSLLTSNFSLNKNCAIFTLLQQPTQMSSG